MAGLDVVEVDQSFIDSVDAVASPSVAPHVLGRRNVMVLKSLGKSLGLHGVRLGVRRVGFRPSGACRAVSCILDRPALGSPREERFSR